MKSMSTSTWKQNSNKCTQPTLIGPNKVLHKLLSRKITVHDSSVAAWDGSCSSSWSDTSHKTTCWGTFFQGKQFPTATKPVFPHFKVLWGGPSMFPDIHVSRKYIFLGGKVREINDKCCIPVDRKRLFLAHPWFNMLFFKECSADYFTRWQTFSFCVLHGEVTVWAM